ncbi:MAG: D-glycerate dehydrogenase [Sphingomonas bacterium]|nr:D-glycerate dehydrogenase [Sphingomonas bacterium]MDB5689864.1 D-glycerate dehydrogenase [Sphingomonas bacterium]
MSRPHVLLTRRWPLAVETYLADRYALTINSDDRPMDEAALIEAMRTHDAICPTVSDTVGAAVIEAAGARARIIGNYGVGYNHVDVAACERAGIALTNTPDVLTDATADLALTLILMVARRAGEGERMVRAGAWPGWAPTQMIGSELKGKTLGLIGFGRIAQATAARAHHGFGMRIVYSAPRRQPAEIEAAVSATHEPSVEALLAQADFVSLHCPGGAATHHLIDAARLAIMKPSAILINTARGTVVDEAALAAALAAGTIAGAGLDVYEAEPQVNAALLRLENVVLLPHLGSATTETRIAMGMRVAANLEAFFAGTAPPDRVA